MGQVVPISPSELDSLAADINEAIADAFDSILVACIKLARAKEVCREQGITFKAWFPGRIALSPNLVYIYARIGAASDPNQALADYRLAKAQSVERARKKVSLRSDSPSAKVAEVDDDEIDTDEYQAEAERLRCIRATLARAQDAIDYASDDILDGVELSEEESREVLTLARKAADLCTKYADTLERRYGS